MIFPSSQFIPRAITVGFVCASNLDVRTTLLGLSARAQEGSLFIARLMRMGPLPALLLVKVVATLLVLATFAFKRLPVVVFLNFWFVCW